MTPRPAPRSVTRVIVPDDLPLSRADIDRAAHRCAATPTSSRPRSRDAVDAHAAGPRRRRSARRRSGRSRSARPPRWPTCRTRTTRSPARTGCCSGEDDAGVDVPGAAGPRAPDPLPLAGEPSDVLVHRSRRDRAARGRAGRRCASSAPRLDGAEAGLATTAVALDAWHDRHVRCPRCGAATRVEQAGWIRVCVVDGSEHYPRTDPAVIMAVVDDADRILLGHAAQWAPGRWSTLAGFVEAGESLEHAVRREVLEETGVVVGEVAYRGSQPWPFPASLMLGFRATRGDARTSSSTGSSSPTRAGSPATSSRRRWPAARSSRRAGPRSRGPWSRSGSAVRSEARPSGVRSGAP